MYLTTTSFWWQSSQAANSCAPFFTKCPRKRSTGSNWLFKKSQMSIMPMESIRQEVQANWTMKKNFKCLSTNQALLRKRWTGALPRRASTDYVELFSRTLSSTFCPWKMSLWGSVLWPFKHKDGRSIHNSYKKVKTPLWNFRLNTKRCFWKSLKSLKCPGRRPSKNV